MQLSLFLWLQVNSSERCYVCRRKNHKPREIFIVLTTFQRRWWWWPLGRGWGGRLPPLKSCWPTKPTWATCPTPNFPGWYPWWTPGLRSAPSRLAYLWTMWVAEGKYTGTCLALYMKHVRVGRTAGETYPYLMPSKQDGTVLFGDAAELGFVLPV